MITADNSDEQTLRFFKMVFTELHLKLYSAVVSFAVNRQFKRQSEAEWKSQEEITGE